MRKITINPKYTKTYVNEENLNKALEKLNLPEDIAYLVCEVEGRITAVFTNTSHVDYGAHIHYIASRGFKVVG